MYIMEKDKKKKATKNKINTQTMLKRGKILEKKKLLQDNKTLLEVYKDIQERQRQEERWFEEKLRKLRDETKQIIMQDEEEFAKKYLTKNQAKTEIIGAKEYSRDEAPDKLKVFYHYARKYGIPFSVDRNKKTLEQLVNEIHAYEMKHRDDIIRKRVLDPLTKTYGLYIM